MRGANDISVMIYCGHEEIDQSVKPVIELGGNRSTHTYGIRKRGYHEQS